VKTHLVSYADARGLASQQALERTAGAHGFHVMHSWDRTRIEQSSLYREHRAMLDYPRGSGYWLWKPYVIAETLREMAVGEIVVYADVDTEIVAPLAPLFACCEHHDGFALFAAHYDEVAGSQPTTCRTWTKRDCFVLMDCDEPRYHDGEMFDASVLVLQKTDAVDAFVQEWLRHCLDDRLLTDRPNTCGLPNLDGFVDHRHDQSILSLCALRRSIEPLRHPAQRGNHLKPEACREAGEWTRYPYGSKGTWSNSPYPTLLDQHRGLRRYARWWSSQPACDLSPDARPILRTDVAARFKGGGVEFKSDQGLVVVDREIGRLFEQLRPLLTGDLDLRAIAARSRPDQRTAMTTLIQGLFGAEMVRRSGREPASEAAPEAVSRFFRLQMELLRRFTDRPEAAFARYRRSRVLLAGAGVAFSRCAASLLRNGLETLFLISSDGVLEDSSEIDATVAALRTQGITSQYVRLDMPRSAPHRVDDVDVVLYCSERPGWLDGMVASRRALAAERPFLGAVVFGGRSYLGPLIRPFIGGCWFCAVMRAPRDLREPHSTVRLAEQAPVAGGRIENGDPTGQLARELASDAAFETFKLLTGVMPAQSETDIRIESLEDGAPTVTMVAHAQTACRNWCNRT
jgi:hypothetical protein